MECVKHLTIAKLPVALRNMTTNLFKTQNQTCNIIEYQTCNVLEKKMKTSSQASLRRRQRGTHKCQWG